MKVDVVHPHFDRHLTRSGADRSQRGRLPIEVGLVQQEAGCLRGALNLVEDLGGRPGASGCHSRAGRLIEGGTFAFEVRRRLRLFELMNQEAFYVTQVGQDVLHRPTYTGSRAAPIVRFQRFGQLDDLGPGLVRRPNQVDRQIERRVHLLILRTSFLASPHMLRPMIMALLLVVAACAEPPADATGAEIYQQLCSNCHGDDLNGAIGGPIGAGSNAASQDDEFLVLTIERGRGRMPSFDSTLTDDQISRVVEYVREQQAGDPG